MRRPKPGLADGPARPGPAAPGVNGRRLARIMQKLASEPHKDPGTTWGWPSQEHGDGAWRRERWKCGHVSTEKLKHATGPGGLAELSPRASPSPAGSPKPGAAEASAPLGSGRPPTAT